MTLIDDTNNLSKEYSAIKAQIIDFLSNLLSKNKDHHPEIFGVIVNVFEDLVLHNVPPEMQEQFMDEVKNVIVNNLRNSCTGD